MRRMRIARFRHSATSVFAYGRQHNRLIAVRQGRGEADRRLRSGRRTPEECPLESFVAEERPLRGGGNDLEAVDRHPLQPPTAAADADVAGCDVPPILVD